MPPIKNEEEKPKHTDWLKLAALLGLVSTGSQYVPTILPLPNQADTVVAEIQHLRSDVEELAVEAKETREKAAKCCSRVGTVEKILEWEHAHDLERIEDR